MGQIVCEGWLIHFLLQERDRRRLRHYWILSNGIISLFSEYNDGLILLIYKTFIGLNIFNFESLLSLLKFQLLLICFGLFKLSRIFQVRAVP